MAVPGYLTAPDLEPCPTRDDTRKCVTETCAPCPKPRKVDWSGWDCCNYWKTSPDQWCNDVVRNDVVNPEKFKYEMFRYQLYAKPSNFDCGPQPRRSPRGSHSLHEVGRQYIAPNTDIRALEQTTYIPVIPTKPGGETDVTFPMTSRTMGQPDVTTACCIPVIPCQPGYKNLTKNIKPTAEEICQQGNYCQPHQRLHHDPCQQDGNLQCSQGHLESQGHGQFGGQGAPLQYILSPRNMKDSGCMGLPYTFPNNGQLPFQVPYSSSGRIPNYNDSGKRGEQCVNRTDTCLEDIDDGTAPASSGKCMNVSTFKYSDRVNRAVAAVQETAEEKDIRLHTMFGAHGANLDPKPTSKRYLPRGDTLTLQGNGFSWDYPKHENRLCYVLERNPRC